MCLNRSWRPRHTPAYSQRPNIRPGLQSAIARLVLSILLGAPGAAAPVPAHAAPDTASAAPFCDPQLYHGVQHCADGDVHTVVVDLTDPHVRVQTVLAAHAGEECNSVNSVSKDPASNCPFPYPFETLDSMLARYRSAGAVVAINADYFGCGVSFPCGSPAGDHGAQGLAVRTGVRLDGPADGAGNDLAATTPSLAISPLNAVTIGIPGSQGTIDGQLDSRYYNTVGGSPLLVENGIAIPDPCSQPYHAPYGDTCTALPDAGGNIIEAQSAGAISGDGATLVLATAGLDAEGLATYLVTNGAALTGGSAITTALKFDGGGSARLAWLDAAGNIDSYSPTGQNWPIAEALVIFSDKIATAEPGLQPARLSLSARPGEPFATTFTLTTGDAPIDKGDVLLVFDRTGSMGDEIDEAKRSALDIMNAVLAHVPNTWFGVASFMDYPGTYAYPGYEAQYGSAGAGDVPWELNLQPTADIASVSAVINASVTLGEGRDGPESYTRMLHELPGIQWRADAKKIAVVFGDAPAHDLDFAGQNWGGDPGPDGIQETADDLDFETVVQQVRNAGISIIAVNSLMNDEGDGDPDFDRYYRSTVATFRGMSVGYDTAVGTNGQYFELADTSQIPLITTNLILAESLSVDELSLRVTEGFESWVTVAPEKFLRVGANAVKEFQVTVTPPPGTPSGFYPFLIQAVGDGAILGATPIEVIVPVAGGSNDLGFRPERDGYRFASGPSVQTWAMFRQFFGQEQVEYSNGNRLHAADRFFTQYYAGAGVRDSAAGFAATSMVNFDPRLSQPNAGSYAMPETTNLFDVTSPTPAIAAAIAFAQAIPLGLEVGFHKANLCAVMGRSPAAMFFSLKLQLQAGSPALISLLRAEPAGVGPSSAHERVLLPYRIEEPAANQATVYVYDPSYPGRDTQAIEFRWTENRNVDEWRYATPDGIWQGDSTTCLLAVTPLSLFTHTGVAWWKAGPSWPPNAHSFATAMSSTAGQTGEPPAVHLYSVSGPAALLITDREGRRLGFDGVTFFDEIAGATFVPLPGSERATAGFYYVPIGAGATAQIIATGAGDAIVHLFGESYLVEVGAKEMITGTTAAIAVDDAGETITLTGLASRLTGAVGINRLLAGEDRTVQIGNLDLQPDDAVSFTFRPAPSPVEQDRVVLQTANNSDQMLSLSVRRSGENTGDNTGYAVFGADNLSLASDSALAVQIDEWTNLAQVTLVATDAAGNASAPTTVTTVAAPATTTIEPTERTLHTKGDQIELPLTVRDQFGAYVADGTSIIISTTLGTLTAGEVTTANGRASTTLIHDGEAGEAVVTARAGNAQATVTILLKKPAALPDEEEPEAENSHQLYLPVIQRQ